MTERRRQMNFTEIKVGDRELAEKVRGGKP